MKSRFVYVVPSHQGRSQHGLLNNDTQTFDFSIQMCFTMASSNTKCMRVTPLQMAVIAGHILKKIDGECIITADVWHVARQTQVQNKEFIIEDFDSS